MIACIELPDRYCAIVWVGKKGILSIAARTWCGGEHDLSRVGVVQLPDRLIDGAPMLSMIGVMDGQRRVHKFCDACKKALQPA